MANWASKALDYLSYVSPAALFTKGATSGFAKPLLGTAGTIAGGYLGGTTGASIGGTAGAALGSAADDYFNPQQASANMRSGATQNTGRQGDWWNGYQAQTQQLPRFTPEQQSAINQTLQRGLQNTNFDALENLARKNFQTKTIPSIAERFTAFGNSGGQGSSAFRSALGSAGSNLDAQLQALRAQYGLSQLQLGLKPTFENIYIPRQGGAAEGAAQGLGQAASKLPDFALKLYELYKQGAITEDQLKDAMQEEGGEGSPSEAGNQLGGGGPVVGQYGPTQLSYRGPSPLQNTLNNIQPQQNQLNFAPYNPLNNTLNRIQGVA